MRIDSLNRRRLGAAALLALAVAVASGVGSVRTQDAKLAAADPENSYYFGSSVAVAGDTAVAGAFAQGAAYVLTRTGDVWTQQTKLAGSDSIAGDQFGVSVAIAGDTAVVGAYMNEAVYVFTRQGTTWSEQQKLTASDAAAGNRFGGSVTIVGDTVVVGSWGVNSQRGAAYVFTRTGTAWTEQAILTAADGVDSDSFGFSVALAGETAVVGALTEHVSQGAAYVFTRSGSTWTQQAKLKAADADPAGGGDFGTSVAIAGDTAVVGSDTQNAYRGAAYVFTRTGTTWTQQQKLTPADAAAGDWFGVSVGLSGETVVAGAYAKHATQGAAYVFKRAGTIWTQESKLAASDAATSSYFGISVAIAGPTALVGAYGKDASKGAAYVFDLSTAPPPAGYCLPTKVKAQVKSPLKQSTLFASGTLDTGFGVPNFTGAATFDIGGFHLDVPAFVPSGKSLTYGAGGISLKIRPAKNRSSHATFSVSIVGDLTGKVDPDGPLSFRFANSAYDLEGTAKVTSGALGPHAVTSPTLSVLKASAVLKGASKHSLSLTIGFATDGIVPSAGEALTVAFGTAFTTTLTGGWVRKGNTWTRKAKAPGITNASVDYRKGTITIAGSRLSLGRFAIGGNPVVITITRGGDTRSACIRMGRAGIKLAY